MMKVSNAEIFVINVFLAFKNMGVDTKIKSQMTKVKIGSTMAPGGGHIGFM